MTAPTPLSLKPKRGEVVVVANLPTCNFCGALARYDFATRIGPWANGCDTCWPKWAARPGVLGVGVAQFLIVEGEAIR